MDSKETKTSGKCKGGVLERSGLAPDQRRAAFVSVCIPARLALATTVYYFEKWYGLTITIIVLIAAIIALLVNLTPKCDVWWDRSTHALFAALLVICASLVIYGILPGWTLAGVLFADVLYGAFSALLHAPWSHAVD